MSDVDRLNTVLGMLTLLLLAYVAVALWLARREGATREHARRSYRARAMAQHARTRAARARSLTVSKNEHAAI